MQKLPASRFDTLNPWSTPSRGRTQLEKVDERKTVEWAVSQGILVTKLTIAGQTGWPDRCFWLPGGRPLLIEFKRVDEAPRQKQAYIHKQLRELGYDVETHDTKEDAIASIKTRRAAAQNDKARRPKRSSAGKVGTSSLPKAGVKVPAR